MRTYIPPKLKPIPENSECVFRGVIFDVYQWQQEMFDGSFDTFERLKRPDTVEAICIDGDEILISKEQQPDAEEFLTIPGGRNDNENENELAAAQREVREELGYVFKNWKLVHANQPVSKIDHIVYTFLATDVEEIQEQQLDAGEKIEVVRYSFDEFKALKYDPMMSYYNRELLNPVNSMEELLALPALYDYGN